MSNLLGHSYLARAAGEPASKAFWRDVLAEFVGSFCLMAAQSALPIGWGKPTSGTIVQVALGMGFVVTTMAWAMGDVGGGHFNPAVTFSMAICSKITIVRALIYIITQCVACIAGAAFIYGVTPGHFRGSLAATTVHGDMNAGQGVAMELWITFMLVLTVLGATNTSRKPSLFMPTIPIGLAVALGIMTAGAHTGGSMNPARSLGPAVVMGIWTGHWVYWVGPLLGSLLATIVYVYILDKIEPVEQNTIDTNIVLVKSVADGRDTSPLHPKDDAGNKVHPTDGGIENAA